MKRGHRLIGKLLLISLIVIMSGCAAEPAASEEPKMTEETPSYTEPQTPSGSAAITAPDTQPEETKQAAQETKGTETSVPAETSADLTTPAEIVITDPRGKVYATSYNWGENASETYTCSIILIPPESEISEANEAGFIWEGWTYKIVNPGPYFELVCVNIPWSGRMWKNEAMEPFWFFGGEEGPETPEYDGPVIFGVDGDHFRFAAGIAVSYQLIFTLAE